MFHAEVSPSGLKPFTSGDNSSLIFNNTLFDTLLTLRRGPFDGKSESHPQTYITVTVTDLKHFFLLQSLTCKTCFELFN